MGGFHKWGYPKWLAYNGNIMFKIDDFGVPPFLETSMVTIAEGEDSRISTRLSAYRFADKETTPKTEIPS